MGVLVRVLTEPGVANYCRLNTPARSLVKIIRSFRDVIASTKCLPKGKISHYDGTEYAVSCGVDLVPANHPFEFHDAMLVAIPLHSCLVTLRHSSPTLIELKPTAIFEEGLEPDKAKVAVPAAANIQPQLPWYSRGRQ
jgi:hypothetical protein